MLTRKTLFEVESLLSKSPPPSNDLKWVLMRKTKTIETRPGYSIHFKKGEIVPTSEDLLKRLVSEGSGKEVECPAAIKTEREEYRKAQDQSKLLENLERAVLDNDIDTLNRTNQSSSSKWRLTKHSVLKWINNNRTALQLRHFPKDIDDILVNKLLLSQPIPKTARPATNKAKMNRLREDYIFKATKKLKTSPDLQFSFFKHDHSFMNIIRSSKLPADKQPKDSTLQNWVREARKLANVKPSVGRPRTNYSEQQ
ncbi:uncharacterized protein METZ01_LOCUS198579 [marine metagenome]|uniref:Uncharacterized protein n=1 Tax=marine metagenome TaxID=408172 RepID=A0A382E5K2_9ZZZZ